MVLLMKIVRFCEETAMPPTKFGRLAVHDPRLVSDLRRGREPSTAMVERCERFMAEYPR